MTLRPAARYMFRAVALLFFCLFVISFTVYLDRSGQASIATNYRAVAFGDEIPRSGPRHDLVVQQVEQQKEAAAAAVTTQQLSAVPLDLTATDKDNFKWYTEAKLRELVACTALGTCPENAHNVVIFGSWHCHIAVFENYRGGEGIWCLGMIESLERQGFTVLLARDDWDYIDHIYRQIPDLVKVIIAREAGTNGQLSTTYYKSPQRPNGIPAWKHFHFFYFPTFGLSVVGNRWTVCAEPRWAPDHASQWNYTFLGYPLDPPLESSTLSVPERGRAHRVYILAKYIHYFYPTNGITPTNPMWGLDFFSRATEQLSAIWPDFEFVGALEDNRNEREKAIQGELVLPPGIRNLGKLDGAQFDEQLAQSGLLLGIGFPRLSPSPYRALAMGVPFLNPHQMSTHSTPDDPFSWHLTQHDTLRLTSEPYVYNVAADDYEGFVAAIKAALSTPIDPFRFEWQSRQAVDRRLYDFVMHDWRSEAASILEQRLQGTETEHPTGDKIGLFTL